MKLRHAAVYMAANIVSAAVGLVGAMVFTRLLAPHDYGISVVASSVGAIMSSVLYTWVRLSVLRFQSAGEDADIRSTALWGYAASSVPLLAAVPVLILAFGLSWEQAVGAGLFTLTIAFFEMQLEMLRAKQQVRAYALGVGLRACAFLGLGLLFVEAGFGGFGLVLALACAYCVASAVLAPRTWRPPIRAFDRGVALQMLLFGLPATFSGLAFALHAASDRLIVTGLLGSGVGGQYGVAADFTRQIILVPAVALGSAIVPAAVRIFSTEGPAAARRHLAESGELMLALLLPAVTGLALVSREVADIVMGPSFRDTAAVLIPMLAFVWLFQAMSQNYVHVSFHIVARSKGMAYQALAALLANFALVFPLTWAFGIRGAAAGVVGAEALGFLAGLFFARAAFPVPLPWRRWARVAAATAAMTVAVYGVGRLSPDVDAWLLPLKVVSGVLVYAGAAALLDVGDLRSRLAARRPARA